MARTVTLDSLQNKLAKAEARLEKAINTKKSAEADIKDLQKAIKKASK
jgi:hypothetical protein